jgi:hypothetical protein
MLGPSSDGVCSMNRGRLVFAQLMDFFPKYPFSLIVQRWKGDYRVRQFSCMDQFLCLAFAQLTGRESLRDIETCLRAMEGKLYHAGFRSTVARNTLAVANERRPWQIWSDLAMLLIAHARRLYGGEPLALELEQTVYALDSTTIDLCLTLFPWASFRRAKAAVKMHALLDLRGNLPTTILITDGRFHDVRALDWLVFEAGAIYIFDRAYVDFERLWRLHQARAFFVTRAKKNFDFLRLVSHPIDKNTGVQCDQTIAPGGVQSAKDYPGHLRRIRFLDPDHGKRLVFLTNNFDLPAETIALLYKQRWQVELFFKWIKQHLRIKSFHGTTENAVKTQIWIAISVYLLAAIIRKELRLTTSLYTILQVLSVTLFEKMPILQALSQPELPLDFNDDRKQLTLFDF